MGGGGVGYVPYFFLKGDFLQVNRSGRLISTRARVDRVASDH